MLNPRARKIARLAALVLLIVAVGIVAVAAVQHYEPNKCEAVQEAKDQGEAKAVDILSSERVAYYTKVLAIFTGVLSTFGLLQIFFLIRADQTTRLAAQAAEKATRTAQAEFIASHRPQLRVGNIVVERPETKGDLFIPGRHVTGTFSITNIGGSRADILSGHCAIFWSNSGLPMPRPYDDAVDNLQTPERTLLSGQSTTAQFRSAAKMPSGVAATIGMKTMGAFTVYVMGCVRSRLSGLNLA